MKKEEKMRKMVEKGICCFYIAYYEKILYNLIEIWKRVRIMIKKAEKNVKQNMIIYSNNDNTDSIVANTMDYFDVQINI